MLSAVGKFLFVLTAMAPLCFAYALDAWVHQKDWKNRDDWNYFFYGAVTIGIALPVICAGIIYGIGKMGQAESLKTNEIKSADKEVLTFLLVYLLPILSKDLIGIYSNPLTSIYVIGIIALAVFHSNAFSFNHLLALIGYHFYEVKNEAGIPYMLITRRTILKKDNIFQVVHVADYIYIDKA